MQWQQVTLVGVGLLGGSLGLALRRRGLARRVVGYVRRPALVADCLAAGAVDHATTDLAAAVTGSDLVILCVPLGQMPVLARAFAPALARNAVVTDVGSVKASVIADLESLIADAGGRFVGSHPMAGSEKTGVTASRAELFESAVCAITPTPRSDPAAVEHVTALWRALGARVLSLDPELHDELVARCSHLPHVLAAQLANNVLDPIRPPAQAELCAGGFRDTTRIAASSPEMWRDIVLANRGNLSRVLGEFADELQAFRRAVDGGDTAAIDQFFHQARQRREAWSHRVIPPAA